MKIAKDTFVSLSYELKVDGETADQATAEAPLEFIYGAGFLLPAFERNIKGKSAGDAFAFALNATDGYGEVMPGAVIELPKSAFMVDGRIEEEMLEAGNHIPMTDNQGNQLVGMVTALKDDVVVMDFNHPLAGKTLNFSGKIEGVREATDVDRAKMMGLGGGCGCDCGDGGCEDCGDDKKGCSCN
ncbi:MAG: FKBP-type peptidyl-prolyl cis-trans isomerase [Rikenellaceae bacterium]|jgi:FKBP-type peptidyl-prolyl cis-trans isomerase SlyD|nr:FKBP-type peptidyl-prolyl cis-trans isomerase [Rikenellaceae bacterium]